jgi:hypothetical protein
MDLGGREEAYLFFAHFRSSAAFANFEGVNRMECNSAGGDCGWFMLGLEVMVQVEQLFGWGHAVAGDLKVKYLSLRAGRHEHT